MVSLSPDIIKKYITLPKNFRTEDIDFDHGFRTKIFPYIKEDELKEIQNTSSDIYDLIVKAGIYYSFVLDIPRIKVHITNYGINKFNQDNSGPAPWWDVRDLGLSWMKKADEYLLEGINMIKNDSSLKSSLLFFSETKVLDFWEVQRFYSINNSMETYSRLSNIINDLKTDFLSQFEPCQEEILNHDLINDYFKKYLLNQAFYDATLTPPFLLIKQGLVIQYEELPWQKSVVLDPMFVSNIQKKFLNSAEYYLKRIFDFINQNAELFPCYKVEERNNTHIISKKSGLFL